VALRLTAASAASATRRSPIIGLHSHVRARTLPTPSSGPRPQTRSSPKRSVQPLQLRPPATHQFYDFNDELVDARGLCVLGWLAEMRVSWKIGHQAGPLKVTEKQLRDQVTGPVVRGSRTLRALLDEVIEELRRDGVSLLVQARDDELACHVRAQRRGAVAPRLARGLTHRYRSNIGLIWGDGVGPAASAAQRAAGTRRAPAGLGCRPGGGLVGRRVGLVSLREATPPPRRAGWCCSSSCRWRSSSGN